MCGLFSLRIKQRICEGINKSLYNLSHRYFRAQIQRADIQSSKYDLRYYSKNMPMNMCY